MENLKKYNKEIYSSINNLRATKEVSEPVFISKLFIDHLRKLPTTTIPENADQVHKMLVKNDIMTKETHVHNFDTGSKVVYCIKQDAWLSKKFKAIKADCLANGGVCKNEYNNKGILIKGGN
jgi:hypothetical protein